MPFDLPSQIALPHTDIAFFADDVSDETTLQEKIKQVATLGPKLVVATRGSIGSMAYDGENFFTYGIVPCEVGDTMGAGDSYIAGFLFGLVEGLSIEEAMHKGAANATETLKYFGAW
jgi:fructoselysine 6-kinase